MQVRDLWAELKSKEIPFVSQDNDAFQEHRVNYKGFQQLPRSRISEEDHNRFAEALLFTRDALLQQMVTKIGSK